MEPAPFGGWFISGGAGREVVALKESGHGSPLGPISEWTTGVLKG